MINLDGSDFLLQFFELFVDLPLINRVRFSKNISYINLIICNKILIHLKKFMKSYEIIWKIYEIIWEISMKLV